MRRFPRAEVPNGSEPLCAMAADVVGVRVRVNETWGECTSPNLHHYPVHGYGSLRAVMEVSIAISCTWIHECISPTVHGYPVHGCPIRAHTHTHTHTHTGVWMPPPAALVPQPEDMTTETVRANHLPLSMAASARDCLYKWPPLSVCV